MIKNQTQTFSTRAQMLEHNFLKLWGSHEKFLELNAWKNVFIREQNQMSTSFTALGSLMCQLLGLSILQRTVIYHTPGLVFKALEPPNSSQDRLPNSYIMTVCKWLWITLKLRLSLEILQYSDCLDWVNCRHELGLLKCLQTMSRNKLQTSGLCENLKAWISVGYKPRTSQRMDCHNP